MNGTDVSDHVLMSQGICTIKINPSCPSSIKKIRVFSPALGLMFHLIVVLYMAQVYRIRG
jgi:hypothetical protein